HWFLRGGRDAFRDTTIGAGPGIFGHVRVEIDTASANIAGNDTLALVADAIVLRELEAPSVTVGVEGPSEIPVEFALSQNYPNPFNPTPSIQFALPKAVNVELRIYDLLGREVRTLVRGDQMPAGFHSVVWDGRNEHLQSVATGVYFYRIVAGDFRQVKKMLMLK
ncbi:MAG: FlgD immunoglobulin-like domain containing protein, partial [Bacteroidota bacterium]